MRALRPEASTEAKEALIRALGARVIASPISAPVRRVVEETFGLDTAQVAPTIGTENDPFTPSARLRAGALLVTQTAFFNSKTWDTGVSP